LESQRTTRRSEFPPTEDEKRERGAGVEGRGWERIRTDEEIRGRVSYRRICFDISRPMALRRPRAVDFCNCIDESRSVLFRECRWRYIDRRCATPSLWSSLSLSLSLFSSLPVYQKHFLVNWVTNEIIQSSKNLLN